MRLLSPRFEEALAFAAELHAEQRRKGTDIPYISHLLAVAGLVLEHGGSEDEAIAALLHDAVEDQGGLQTLDLIRNKFGDEVALIVDACTDAHTQPKPPWKERKQAYIDAIPHKPEAARRVSLADKVHNARSILADVRVHGDGFWARFSASKADSIWYYRELVRAFRKTGPLGLAEELDRVVAEIEALDKQGVLERAISLAAKAHAGQVDKAGAAYILHPLRVMMEMARDEERIAAVLHDAIEDSDGRITFADIEAIGAPPEAVEAVRVLTRTDDGSEPAYAAYIDQVAANPIARRVKLADLRDNLNTRRLPAVTDRDAARLTKYLKTYAKLEAVERR
jgi:(p)ppGpp synthase/HD superfamily hydrolase